MSEDRRCPVCGAAVTMVSGYSADRYDEKGDIIRAHSYWYPQAVPQVDVDALRARIALLEAENAALRQDAEVGRAVLHPAINSIESGTKGGEWTVWYRTDDMPDEDYECGATLRAALDAAGLLKEEVA